MPSGHPAFLTIAGETRTVAAWAALGGVHPNTVTNRLRRGLRPAVAVFGDPDIREQPKPKRGRLKIKPLPVLANMSRWGSVESITFRRLA